jgi:hypothetical protein
MLGIFELLGEIDLDPQGLQPARRRHSNCAN